MAKKTFWDWALTSGISTGIGKKKGDGGNQTYEPVPLMWPGEAELRDRLLDYTKKYGDANANLNNLTPQERQALEFLDVYGEGTPGGSPYNMAAGGELLRTLSGAYDPESSAYYKPVISGIEQRRDQAVATNRRGYQLGGNLSSLARARADAETGTSYDAQIAEMMLGLQERERGRMLSAVPAALNLGQYVEEGPLRKAEAFRSVGSIPRDLESNAINLGQGILTNYSPTYYNPLNYMQLNNRKSQLGSGLGGALGAGIGAAFGGPPGAAVGYAAGGSLGSGLSGYFG